MSAARIGLHMTWGLVALLSVGVGGYALYHTATGFVHVPSEVTSNAFFSPLGLQMHIAASGVALLVAHGGVKSPRRRQSPDLVARP